MKKENRSPPVVDNALVGHPFGKKLFGKHKDLRRQFAPNFTPKALQTYTEIQQRIIHKHLAA